MNFTLLERLQLLLALIVALTATVPGVTVALLLLGRLAVARHRSAPAVTVAAPPARGAVVPG